MVTSASYLTVMNYYLWAMWLSLNAHSSWGVRWQIFGVQFLPVGQEPTHKSEVRGGVWCGVGSTVIMAVCSAQWLQVHSVQQWIGMAIIVGLVRHSPCIPVKLVSC